MIYSSKLFYKFLFFMPFVAVISNKLSSIIAYGIIGFFLVSFFLFKIKFTQVNIISQLYVLFLIIILYFVFIYHLLAYDYINIYYIQFFGAQLIFFFIISLFIDVNYLTSNHLKTFFESMVFIIFFSVIIDYFLIKNGLMTSQLMFKQEATSYHGKALGLFGQFSINTSYIIVFYMLFLSFSDNINKFKNIILLSMITITIVIQNSGTGYILYLLLLGTIFYKSKLARYILLPFFILLFFIIIMNNLVAKISFDYLYVSYQYFSEIVNLTYFSNVHSVYDVLFGINGNYNFPIDFGPIFMIAKVGLLYFLFYVITIFYMIYKVKDRYLRMSILSLVFANLHYPALFYPIINVLLPLLYIYNEKKQLNN